MLENYIVLLFTYHGTGLAPKTWKKFSSVKNKTPYGAGTVLHKISGRFNFST